MASMVALVTPRPSGRPGRRRAGPPIASATAPPARRCRALGRRTGLTWATPNARALVAGCGACARPRPRPAGRRSQHPQRKNSPERRGQAPETMQKLASSRTPAGSAACGYRRRPEYQQPKLSLRLRHHDPVHPRATAEVSPYISDFAKKHGICPGHLATTAEIVERCYHCVIPMSLTALDAGRPCQRYCPESLSTFGLRTASLCWFRCLSPMLGQSPTAG